MAVMNEVIDSRAFSNFCGINSPDEVLNGDTIGRFRNILNRNGLQEKIFATVVKILMERGLILKKGTIVDSTFIESPSSTKNKEKKRDPEAHSAKKGNTWHFGYKAHIGVGEERCQKQQLKYTWMKRKMQSYRHWDVTKQSKKERPYYITQHRERKVYGS